MLGRSGDVGTQQLSRDTTAGWENPTQTHEPGGGEISVTEEGGQRDIMTDTRWKMEPGMTSHLS